MKAVQDLNKALQDEEWRENQFVKSTHRKNILFINPQLSGKHLYKMILPFFAIVSRGQIKTAMQSLSKYDPETNLLDGTGINIVKDDLSHEMVMWSDYIVFPFTAQPLVAEVYHFIRVIKPSCKIIFMVDFNFYELSEKHPYHYIFSDEIIKSGVEDNMYYSDMVLVSNLALMGYVQDKFKELIKSKYSSIESSVKISTQPIYIDAKLVTANVEYDPLELLSITLKGQNKQSIHTQKKLTNVSKGANKAKKKKTAKKATKKVVKKATKKKTAKKVVKKAAKKKTRKSTRK